MLEIRTRSLSFISIIVIISTNHLVWSQSSQMINLQPRQQINAGGLGFMFGGNGTRYNFKLLERDEGSLLVGARNAVYNLSLPTLTVQQHLEWPSTKHDKENCIMKGKSEEDCHNYIRVLAKMDGGKTLVCGTNSFSPSCRLYATNGEIYSNEREFDGRGICPYDPAHNSTAILLTDSYSMDVYSGTVADLGGTDPLIYRRSITGSSEQQLRSTRNDLKILNEPDFVSSFSDEDYVYFWFREVAAEKQGTEVYGTVARVCKKDRGGPKNSEIWSSRWTTFTKARLNCSLQGGSRPFAFGELQSTSGLVEDAEGNKKIYAVLTTPPGPLQISAICAFDMKDVRDAFDRGQFLSQKDPNSLWRPVPSHHLSLFETRPGSCNYDSRSLNPDVIHFIHQHPLIERRISNIFSAPLYIDSTLSRQLTQIAIDPQVRGVSGRKFDVIFAGTSDGKVLKIVNSAEGSKVKSVLVESIQVFSTSTPVRNLMFSRTAKEEDSGLIVVSHGQVRFLPVHHCQNRSQSCSSCLSYRDPYCAWDLRNDRCVGKTNGNWLDGDFVQNIREGKSSLCPEGALDPEYYAVNEVYVQETKQAAALGGYSTESMGIAIFVTLLLAMTGGFLIGLLFARWRGAGYASSSASGSDYDTHSIGHSRLTKHDAAAKQHAQLQLYSSPPMAHHSPPDAVGLVVTMPDGSATLGRREKNLISLNNGTLPKDYRVKKVYL